VARQRKRNELTSAGARDRALRVLGRREHSAAELQRKLEQRGVDAATAGAVVEDLQSAGWQSDARYAEMLVRSRIAQGYGPLRIEAELEQAAVPAERIAEALSAAEPDWRALVVALHRRRFGEIPKKAADWQKQYRYLAGRGFTAEQVHAALRRAPEEIE
jgi:regulatory protein